MINITLTLKAKRNEYFLFWGNFNDNIGVVLSFDAEHIAVSSQLRSHALAASM